MQVKININAKCAIESGNMRFWCNRDKIEVDNGKLNHVVLNGGYTCRK